jgi:predicted ester cyclase
MVTSDERRNQAPAEAHPWNTAAPREPAGGITDVNKALVHLLIDVLNGATTSVDEILAADYLEHAIAPFGTEEPGRVHGPTSVRTTAAWLRAQFPDLVLSVLATVAEGDLVAVRVQAEGTNNGTNFGPGPATGRHFRAEQSHWYRIEGGRVAEHWAIRDDLRAMLDLGVIRATAPIG